MTVVEYMKQWLTDSSLMTEFNGIHVDFTKDIPNECGLYVNGTTQTGEDIVGNTEWQMNFVVYSGLHAFADYDRLSNNNFLEKLSYALNTISEVAITETVNDVVKNGTITKVRSSNAMLYAIPTGDINDGVTYQIQIQVNYTIKDE